MLPKETDWAALWRELSARPRHGRKSSEKDRHYDQEGAREYESRSQKRNKEREDPLLDYVLKDIKPDETVLDIGAGTGRWTIPLAGAAKKVTAIEPSRAMLEILQKRAGEKHLKNIEVIQATWEDAQVKPHDVSVCAHAMYNSPDLIAFVRKMEATANKRCYLAMRLIPVDGVMAELSRQIYGNPNDSPNFVVGYNALYAAGIYANVVLEEGTFHWTSPDIQSAFERAKRHLHIGETDKYDKLILELLKKRLMPNGDSYIWTDGMRSALIWWEPHKTGREFTTY